MAIKIYEQFAPFANPADGDYPYGSIKNDSIPGAEDGTPLDAEWGNDYAGFDAELFAQAGVVPSGVPDKKDASQRVDALHNVFDVYGTVADIASGKFKVGKRVAVTDRANGVFLVQSGGTADGFGVLDAGNSNTAVIVVGPNTDVIAFGGDSTRLIDSQPAFAAMVAAGNFVINAGTYLLDSAVSVDLKNINNFSVASGVTIEVDNNVGVLRIFNLTYDYDFKGMIININFDGYSDKAVVAYASDYIPVGLSLDKIGNKNYFGNIVCYYTVCKGGASQINKSGTAFMVQCDGPSPNNTKAFVYTRFDFSAKGFQDVLRLKCDGFSNFMSSCTFDVTTWWCNNVIHDESLSTGSAIGDCIFNLKIQPDSTFEKIIRTYPGGRAKINSSVINYTLWDVQTIPVLNVLIDANASNQYNSSYLEVNTTPVTALLNYANSPLPNLSPFKNFNSRYMDGDKQLHADNFKIEYMFLKGVLSTDTAQVAMTKIKANLDILGVRNNMRIEYEATTGAYAAVIANLFKPFWQQWGRPNELGQISVDIQYYNGEIRVIRVIGKSPTANYNLDYEYQSVYTTNFPTVKHTIVKHPSDTLVNIKLLTGKFTVFAGFTTFASDINKNVTYDGSGWRDQSGVLV